jgi:hypothetical protein
MTVKYGREWLQARMLHRRTCVNLVFYGVVG